MGVADTILRMCLGHATNYKVCMVNQAWQFTFSVMYALGQIALGLLLHPYQTVQSLVRDKVFFWMAALPLLVSIIVKIVWSFVLVPLVRLVFSCAMTSFWGCELIPFFAQWLLFFCLYWQILVAYLFVRFSLAFRSA